MELFASGSVVSAALATPPKLNVRVCCDEHADERMNMQEECSRPRLSAA